jgi:hypothetical protein
LPVESRLLILPIRNKALERIPPTTLQGAKHPGDQVQSTVPSERRDPLFVQKDPSTRKWRPQENLQRKSDWFADFVRGRPIGSQ